MRAYVGGTADPDTTRAGVLGGDCVAATKPRSDWNVPPNREARGPPYPEFLIQNPKPGPQIEGDTGLCEPGLAAGTFSVGKRFSKSRR